MSESTSHSPRRTRRDELPSRRAHTRWILVGSVAGLAMLLGFVFWLEAIHPQNEGLDLRVEGVPDLGDDEVRSCTAANAESVREELVALVDEGARVSSPQVYACPRAWDGRTVRFAGEAIGEVLPRRGGAWLQVNDDAYALEVGPVIGHRELSGFNTGLSVWLPDGLHERIETVGRPSVRGDVLLIEGTIRRADPDDGGGITLRAEAVEVLAEGVQIETPFHTVQAVIAVLLALLAAASLVWSRRARAR